MKYIKTAIVLNMFTLMAQAQHTVRVKITGLPAAPVADTIYITGSFNGWNPADENYRLRKGTDGFFFIEFPQVDAAAYEFKFTRGGWDKAETNNKGEELRNRMVNIKSDTSFYFSIAGWKDAFKQFPKVSTASEQVTVIDTAFRIPQLGRTRRIWIYLPKEYKTSRNNYPVLYMHDGQNLFDNATAFAGEWGVDETMDSMKNACIVVGIDNGGIKRMNEYNPNNTKQFGKGEGKEFLSFIVTILKPFIDKKYRTLKDKEHTYMAGSSMGGLITFYAGLYYPNTFGALGILSPSFWIAPNIKTHIKQLAKKNTHGVQKYYFYAGAEEDKKMEEDMKAVAAEIKKIAGPVMKVVVNPTGKHNEATWAEVFPELYHWIL